MFPPTSGPAVSPLASRLRTLRRQHLLSQTQLAFAAGITPEAVRAIEHGRTRHPHGDTLRALATVLNVDLTELLPSDEPDAVAA